MNTPVEQIKTAATTEVHSLRAELDAAYAAHKWFVLAGFVLGLIAGAWLAHVI